MEDLCGRGSLDDRSAVPGVRHFEARIARSVCLLGCNASQRKTGLMRYLSACVGGGNVEAVRCADPSSLSQTGYRGQGQLFGFQLI